VTREELGTLGALALGLTPFAMAFGVAAVAAGVSPTSTMLLSIVVYAGASQFSAIGVLATGGSSALALVTVYLVNLRFIPLGLAMPPSIARTWPQRLLASHLLVDPALAIAYATTPDRRARLFWVFSVLMYVLWIAGTAIGVVAGTTIPDPELLGLDAALPCAFIALLASWRHDAPTRRATFGGAGLTAATLAAGATTLATPIGVLGAVFGLPRRRDRAVRAAREEAAARDAEEATRGRAAGEPGPHGDGPYEGESDGDDPPADDGPRDQEGRP
jgi:4-azaleucine resistance transporter AzlC